MKVSTRNPGGTDKEALDGFGTTEELLRDEGVANGGGSELALMRCRRPGASKRQFADWTLLAGTMDDSDGGAWFATL